LHVAHVELTAEVSDEVIVASAADVSLPPMTAVEGRPASETSATTGAATIVHSSFAGSLQPFVAHTCTSAKLTNGDDTPRRKLASRAVTLEKVRVVPTTPWKQKALLGSAMLAGEQMVVAEAQ
jgi:hypothetical protein